jgi:hypothetical protein
MKGVVHQQREMRGQNETMRPGRGRHSVQSSAKPKLKAWTWPVSADILRHIMSPYWNCSRYGWAFLPCVPYIQKREEISGHERQDKQGRKKEEKKRYIITVNNGGCSELS